MSGSYVKGEWAAFIGALALLAAMAVATPAPERVSRLEHQRQMQQSELRQRFDQSVAMLHARQYEHAITALHRVLELAPDMPEAHVNMGYALLGLERADAARGFFLAAIDLRPGQANATMAWRWPTNCRRTTKPRLAACAATCIWRPPTIRTACARALPCGSGKRS